MRGRLLLAAAAAVVAAGVPSTAAASTRIATVDRPTPLSAYGSSLVFSRRDPATDRFRLWHSQGGGTPVALAIKDRAVPFDADLGRGTRGQLLAVYSRCATEPGVDWDQTDSPPAYAYGEGCDLFQYDFSTRRERRLAVSSPGYSEVLPTVSGNTVAFVRADHGRGRLYARSGLEPPRELAPGPRHGMPLALDLSGRRLAFAWLYEGDPGTLSWASAIRVDDVETGKLLRRVDTFGGGGLTTIGRSAPAFDGSRLYWARLCQGDEAGCPGRDGLMRTGGKTGVERADMRPRDLWQARGRDVTYVLRDSREWRNCVDAEGDPEKPTCTILAQTPDYRPWSAP